MAAASVLATSAGPALAAAGQQICIGGPSSAVTAPNSSGKCNKGTLTTLASEQDLSSLKTRVSALESDNRTLK